MSRARFLTLVCLLALGIAVSVLFGQLGHPFASTAYRELRLPLSEFPVEIEGWRGVDEDLGERVKDIAGMDRYLNRLYTGPGGERVLLYVAYYGNRQRGLRAIFHNPTICLPSAGWTERGTRKERVALAGGPREEMRVSLHTFDRRGREAVILNFYVVDGELLDGPPREKPEELALQKLSMSFDPGFYAQVQVVPIEARRFEEGRRVCLEFLRVAGPHLFRHF